MMLKWKRTGIVLAAFWISFVGAGADQYGEDDLLFRDVARDLRCPTCQGMSILESEASFSLQMREVVRQKLLEGMSKDEILKHFTERYGPWILRQPPKEGVNLIAWVAPISLMVLGPLAMWLVFWRRRKIYATGGIRSMDQIMDEMKSYIERERNQIK